MASTLRPTIEVLEEFAKPYFKKDCPAVEWKKLKNNWCGLACFDKNRIFLHPNMGLKDLGCIVGGDAFYVADIKVKLRPGEQYFLTLLHEVAHFRIKKKVPLEWVRLKKQLEKDAKDQLRMEKVAWKTKLMTPKDKQRYIKEKMHYDSWGALKRKTKESDDCYYGRCENFRSWLMGDMISEHIAVERWAREEFKRRRKEIQKILTAA